MRLHPAGYGYAHDDDGNLWWFDVEQARWVPADQADLQAALAADQADRDRDRQLVDEDAL